MFFGYKPDKNKCPSAISLPKGGSAQNPSSLTVGSIQFNQNSSGGKYQTALSALDMIYDIAIDYDGENSVEGLKKLIDEIKEIAYNALHECKTIA